MLDPVLIFEGFFLGADGVLIAGCYEQDCHYDTGFLKTKTRYSSIKEMLGQTGIHEKRVKITSISAGEGEKFAHVITDFKKELEELGPIKPGEFTKPIVKKKLLKEKAKLDEL
jgi:coenzyme F420-reducing hydrogenase delta subunit